MKRFVTIMVLAAWLAIGFSTNAIPAPKKHRNPIMQQKLVHAQKVLEGIAVQDFSLVRTNAEALITLSNKAEWQALKTSDYEVHSLAFRRYAQALVSAAKKKNVDAAALAYVQMTMNCVNCHKHVREVRMTRGPDPWLPTIKLGE